MASRTNHLTLLERNTFFPELGKQREFFFIPLEKRLFFYKFYHNALLKSEGTDYLFLHISSQVFFPRGRMSVDLRFMLNG